jgi:hypothetical protein
MEGMPARQITSLQGGQRGRNCAETKHLRPFSLPYDEELIDKGPIM